MALTPKNTVKAYKLFRVHPKHPGKLFPLFVNANEPVEMGKWQDAQIGEMTGNKVKSKIGPLAFRPGWHAGDVPVATHIGENSDPVNRPNMPPDVRPDNHVWAEVEMPDDVDWQTEANKRGTNAQGRVIPVKAHITDQIPKGGHYRYKTNSNMTGNWLIGGSMKVNRVLDDKEVRSINKAAGVADLPRAKPFNAKKYGFASGGLVAPDEWKAEEHVNYLPAKQREANKAKFLSQSKVKHVVHHGTMSNVKQFRTPAYFGNKDVANQFSTPEYMTGSSQLFEGEHPNVMPVHLNLKNPKVFTDEDDYEKHVMDSGLNAQHWIKKGYDGIVFAPEGDMEHPDAYYVAFHPNQIKSAIGNQGTYSKKSGDITKAHGGRVTHAHHLDIEERPL